MRLIRLSLFALCSALVQSPASIDELVSWVYPENAPQFTTVPSPATVAVAGNETSILKISNLDISPYPLVPGHVDFEYLHSLVKDVPKESTIRIHAFVDGQEYYNGEVGICEYLPFAKLNCPVEKYADAIPKTTKLQVPSNGYDNRFSFVAKVETPEDETIVHLAVIIDCVEPVKDEL